MCPKINVNTDLTLNSATNASALMSQRNADPPSRVVNIFHCTANNIGDLMSGPGQYCWPKVMINIPVEPVQQSSDNFIVGGGQLFSQLPLLVESIKELNAEAKIVGWGVGLPPNGVRDGLVRDVTRQFDLFGTRNYDRRHQLPFVPCASCLSPLFDNISPPQHDLVFYLHRRKGEKVLVPPNLPVMTNAERTPKETIDFIASGATIVTSSYHGVYWAQLLGRRVICIPYNNKFETFQYRPAMAEIDTWRSKLSSAFFPPLLEEYRALNQAFAKQSLEVWGG